MGALSGWGQNVKSIMQGDPAKAMANMSGGNNNGSGNGNEAKIDEISKKLDTIIELLTKLTEKASFRQ